MGSELINKSVGIANAFTTTQDVDRPVLDGKKPISSANMDKDAARQKMARMRVGLEVNYNLGRGRIVSKRGDYLTISHNDGRHVDTIHVGEAWMDGERMLYDKLWDQMSMETRNDLLSKHKLPLAYVNRHWNELPRELIEHFALVSKENDGYYEHSGGGHAGREPGVTRDDESRSHRDVTGESGAGRNDPPQADKRQAPGLKKAYETLKSDVEHGMYGGITTDQEPLEGKGDYEEDKREGDRKQIRYQDHDAGAPRQNGINPNQKEIKIKGDTPPAAEMDDIDKEGDGSVSTSTNGVNNPVHGGGPTKLSKSDEDLNWRNKYNRKPGMQMSPEELEKWHKDNPKQ